MSTQEAEPKLVRRSPVSRWGILARDLRRSIELQEYLVGEQLPTELELAETYGVSRITVRQALAVLTDDGLIERRHGSGTFVAEGLNVLHHDLAVTRPWKERMETSDISANSVQIDAPSHLEAPRSLVIDVGVNPENVGSRYFKRLQYVGGVALGLSESWLAPQIARHIEDAPLLGGSLSKTLEVGYGIHPAAIKAYIHAETATPETADLLSCPPDEPLVVINDLILADDDSVISVSSTRWLGHRVRFRQEYVAKPV